MPVGTGGSLPLWLDDEGEAQFTTTISADAAVVDGHYPEFPIVPGAVLVELAIEAAQRSHHGRLVDRQRIVVETARFTSAVRPGDSLLFQTDSGVSGDEVVVKVTGRIAEGRDCCKVRIRFRQNDGRP